MTTHFVIDIKSISVNKNYFKNRENVYTCVVLWCVNFFYSYSGSILCSLSLSLVKFSNRRRQLALVKSQTSVSVRDSRRTLFERTRIYEVNKSPRSGDRECRVIEHRVFPLHPLSNHRLRSMRSDVSLATRFQLVPPLLLARSYFPPIISRPLFFSPQLTIVPTVYCVIIIPIHVVASLLSARAPVVVRNHRIGDGR